MINCTKVTFLFKVHIIFLIAPHVYWKLKLLKWGAVKRLRYYLHIRDGKKRLKLQDLSKTTK